MRALQQIEGRFAGLIYYEGISNTNCGQSGNESYANRQNSEVMQERSA